MPERTSGRRRVWWHGIDMVKVTFSLDDGTVDQIRRAAARLGRPQSQIVREAIADYAARVID